MLSSTLVILLTLGSVPTRTGSGKSLVSHLFILSGAYTKVHRANYFSLLVLSPIIFFCFVLLIYLNLCKLNGWENYLYSTGLHIWWDISFVSQNGRFPYVKQCPALENVWHSWPSELNSSVPAYYTNKNVLRGQESLNYFLKVRILFSTVSDLLW